VCVRVCVCAYVCVHVCSFCVFISFMCVCIHARECVYLHRLDHVLSYSSQNAREFVYLIPPHHFVSFNMHLSLFFSSVSVLDDVRANGCPLPWPRACINAAALR
jgi:hypothetical protein